MRYLVRLLLVVGVVCLGVSAAATANATPGPEPAAPRADHIITFPAGGFQYSPADITIQPGDEVEWDGQFAAHPLVSDDGLWPVVRTGDSFQYTFTDPGIYRYHCELHGAAGGIGMSGIIRVGLMQRVYLPGVFR